MTATDAQVRQMMRERNNGKTQQQAAVKVNTSTGSVPSLRLFRKLPTCHSTTSSSRL
jgi:hypothetical protein